MSGVILETTTNRKLLIFGVILLLLQIAFYLIGGLVAPAPYNVQTILGTKCLDKGAHIHKQKWFSPRDFGDHITMCEAVSHLDDPKIQAGEITANQVVFSFIFPHIRNNVQLKMSRWFQNIVSIFSFEIMYNSDLPFVSDAELTMEVRLARMDEGDSNWTLLAESQETRTLHCNATTQKDGHPLDCDMLPFFELGSSHYHFYLINMRFPVHELQKINTDLMSIADVNLVTIHQNGGFTRVWFSLKTVCFPVLLAILCWYWKRISGQQRSPNLLEKMLFGLGISLSFLNFPIEWFTLAFDMPYMLLLTDIRQGIFYSFLMSFWIVFTGEHMMDSTERNRLVWYWKHLSAVAFGCICLFVFEMCERGVQLTNPFFSIWSNESGSKLALAFIILAGIAAGVYFLFLCYMVFRVFRNIGSKSSGLPQMPKARRKFYLGLIYRFRFLMLSTLFCAAITVIFFIIGEVSESSWKWGEDNNLQHTSAFLTGVYGMWNIYVCALLILYAPSTKQLGDTDEDDDSEQIEFTALPSEASALAAFVTKSAMD